MKPNELDTQLKEVFVIDVRSHFEYVLEWLKYSRNIELEELIFRISEIPTDRKIVLVCATGTRAAKASKILWEAGIATEVLEGGLRAWKAEDRSLEKGCKMPSLEGQTKLVIGFLVVLSVVVAWLTRHDFYMILPIILGIAMMVSGAMDSGWIASALLRANWNKTASKHYRDSKL